MFKLKRKNDENTNENIEINLEEMKVEEKTNSKRFECRRQCHKKGKKEQKWRKNRRKKGDKMGTKSYTPVLCLLFGGSHRYSHDFALNFQKSTRYRYLYAGRGRVLGLYRLHLAWILFYSEAW